MGYLKPAMAALFALGLTACDAPVSETAAGASPAGAVWVLKSINQRPVEARTTLRFLPDGSIAGSGPCNRYSASQKIPLPWFEAGPISITERSCEFQSEERRYVRTLGDVIFAEITGDTMLLTGDNREELLYRLE